MASSAKKAPTKKAPAKKAAAKKVPIETQEEVAEVASFASPVSALVEEEMLADMTDLLSRIFASAGVSELAPEVTDYLIEHGVKKRKDLYLPFVLQLIADMRSMSATERANHFKGLRGTRAGLRFQKDAFWQNDKWAASAYVADLELALLRERPKINEGAYSCKRCQSKRTRLRTNERGRGDEMMPVMIECVGCGHTWNE